MKFQRFWYQSQSQQTHDTHTKFGPQTTKLWFIPLSRVGNYLFSKIQSTSRIHAKHMTFVPNLVEIGPQTTRLWVIPLFRVDDYSFFKISID